MNGIVIGGSTIHFHKCLFGLLDPSAAVVEAWCFAEGQHAYAKNDSPDPAQTDDDAPRGRAVHLVSVGSIVEAGSQEDAHSNEKLVGADQSTTDPRRRRLGLIHGHQETKSTNTEAGDQSTDHDLLPGRDGGDLNDETDGDHDTPEANGDATTNAISDRSSHQRADQCADGQQTNNETGSNVAKGIAVTRALSKTFQKVGHFQEARNLTSIITARRSVQP